MDIEYVMYVDFTMALAEREWPPWAPFRHTTERDAWMQCETRAYRNAKHMFTKSEYTRDSLIRDYDIDPRRVTSVGASGNFSDPDGTSKANRGKCLLFISSNFKRKGGDLVFTAFERVRATHRDLRLLLVGTDFPRRLPPGAELRGVVNSEDMRQVFSEADLLAAPSRCDPLCLSVIEAMNYGVPCIVTRSCGMPELVGHPKTEFVIEKDDVDGLTHAIEKLLTDRTQWQAVSDDGRQQVKTRWNWQTVVARMQRIIQTL
jgi:glycosyltransferase involved in cell wall biosynthesis